MIDEASRRRPDWVEGEWIKLEDGQEWCFPKPRVEYRIRPGESASRVGVERASARFETSRRFGDRFWELHSAMVAAFISKDPDDLFQAYASVGMDLLIRNYELTTDEISDLLILIPGDDLNMAMWGAIADVAMGMGKKADAAG